MKNKESLNIANPNVDATSKTENIEINDVEKETLEIVQNIETSSIPSGEKEKLKNRITSSIENMLSIFYFAIVLAGVADQVEKVAIHQRSRYKVESKIVARGQVEYAHEDKKTTHILNLLSGKEKLNDSDKRDFLVDYLSARVDHKKFLGVYIKQEELNTMPFDKLYEIACSFVEDDSDNNQYFSRKQTIDKIFDVEPDKFDLELYNALWQLEKECGNPKVRFSLDQKTNTGGRSFYDIKTNTIYICSRKNNDKYIDHYIAELAHANQFSEKPILSNLLEMRDRFKMKTEILLGDGNEDWKIRAEKSQDKLYDQPGTLEHDAHSVVEPKLRKKIKDLFIREK